MSINSKAILLLLIAASASCVGESAQAQTQKGADEPQVRAYSWLEQGKQITSVEYVSKPGIAYMSGRGEFEPGLLVLRPISWMEGGLQSVASPVEVWRLAETVPVVFAGKLSALPLSAGRCLMVAESDPCLGQEFFTFWLATFNSAQMAPSPGLPNLSTKELIAFGDAPKIFHNVSISSSDGGVPKLRASGILEWPTLTSDDGTIALIGQSGPFETTTPGFGSQAAIWISRFHELTELLVADNSSHPAIDSSRHQRTLNATEITRGVAPQISRINEGLRLVCWDGSHSNDKRAHRLKF